MTRIDVFLVCLASLLTAARPAARASESPTERPHIRAEVTVPTKARLKELVASDLDITDAHGTTFEVLVTRAELDELMGRGFPTRIVEADVYAPGGLRGGGWLPEYMSYTEAVAALNAFASTYPAITDLSSIGTSTEGRDIWALKISDNPTVDESEPEVLILGNTHAREQITQIICVAIADSLLSNYGSDPQYTEWVDEREIWIVPVLNPDGLTWVETNDLFWRKNRWVDPQSQITYGVDLNRNYAYEWGHDDNGSDGSKSAPTYRGPSAASEPETQVMQNFIDSRDLAFCISYHAYGNLTLWAPGYKPAIPVDQDLFLEFGKVVNQQNGYEPGNTAMGNIYLTNGVMDDWVYLSPTHSKVYSFTPEVGTGSDYFNPPASRIPTLVLEGSVAGWTALEYADRPERLAPPGQPTMHEVASRADGDYSVSWSGPTTADTEVAVYELTEKEGPSVVTDDAESGSGHWDLGDWAVSGARSFSGSSSFHSGSGDEFNHILLAKEGYEVQAGDSFTFQAWYDIENNWDYAYVLLSADGGRSLTNLEGTGTTMSDPNGNNADHGITGSSGGWQLHTYDLTPWVGQTVWLGLRYYTDQSVQGEGFYADDLHPVQEWASTTILSSAVVGTEYPVTGQPVGTYYYSARGQDAEGDWGYPAANVSVIVEAATDVSTLGGRQVFSLSENVPNPFGARTTIRFSLPVAAEHSLIVYNVAGRRVRSLSSGWVPAGAHEVRWDGRNEEGDLVPSGVYFYRLSAEGRELHERAVLRR
jgi:murein tripeptide amidase MpaA